MNHRAWVDEHVFCRRPPELEWLALPAWRTYGACRLWCHSAGKSQRPAAGSVANTDCKVIPASGKESSVLAFSKRASRHAPSVSHLLLLALPPTPTSGHPKRYDPIDICRSKELSIAPQAARADRSDQRR